MIRADQIPPDAMYAAWKAMNAGMTLNDAIAAAINAWPGNEPAMQMSNDDWTTLRGVRIDALILPITETSTKENNNG